MKNTCIFSVFVFVASSYYAQNGSETRQVTTQSNGVIVHVSAGNEGFVPAAASSAQPVRSIDEWTLPECIDALRVIDEKIEQTGTSEQERPAREAYFQQKTLIEKRKAALMTNQ
jgi:hypothetical protein